MSSKKTREEVDELKRNWEADPCWELSETEGFEEFKEELVKFEEQKKAAWKRKEGRRLHSLAMEWGVNQLVFAERFARNMTKLLFRLSSLERRVEDLENR